MQGLCSFSGLLGLRLCWWGVGIGREGREELEEREGVGVLLRVLCGAGFVRWMTSGLLKKRPTEVCKRIRLGPVAPDVLVSYGSSDRSI